MNQGAGERLGEGFLDAKTRLANAGLLLRGGLPSDEAISLIAKFHNNITSFAMTMGHKL